MSVSRCVSSPHPLMTGVLGHPTCILRVWDSAGPRPEVHAAAGFVEAAEPEVLQPNSYQMDSWCMSPVLLNG